MQPRVLITGASSGIGRAAAELLSANGYRLILVARDLDRLSAVAKSLHGEGHVTSSRDLSDLTGISEWLKAIVGDAPLNGIVHAAGAQDPLPLRFVTTGNYQRVMNLNLGAAVALAQGFRQHNIAAKPASIVLVSSVMGLVGQPANCVYSASKGGLIALCRSLALELAREGIRVNCVAPGLVETELTKRLRKKMTAEQFANVESMHPLGLGQPDDVANAIHFLLGETARWITGSTLVVDGGYTAA